MARTVQDVVTQARVILQDARSDSYRYSDAELVANINEALGEVRRMRPDIIAGRIQTGLSLLSAAAMSAALPVDDMLFVPIVNYVCGRAELRDDQYTEDSRAATLLQLFTAALTGGSR